MMSLFGMNSAPRNDISNHTMEDQHEKSQFAVLVTVPAAFVFSLAACGGAPSSAPAASGSAPASGSEPAAPADPTTLKVYTWWDVTKFEHLQKMQQDFEAANPDIKLEFVTIQQICRYHGLKLWRRRDPGSHDDAGHGRCPAMR